MPPSVIQKLASGEDDFIEENDLKVLSRIANSPNAPTMTLRLKNGEQKTQTLEITA